jgi:hypothetical protein
MTLQASDNWALPPPSAERIAHCALAWPVDGAIRLGGMGIRDRLWPTKPQAVLLCVLALLSLASNAVAVLVRPATTIFWVIQAAYLGVLGLSAWGYRRASKTPPTPQQNTRQDRLPPPRESGRLTYLFWELRWVPR